MRGPFPNIEFYQCVTYGAYTAEWQEKVRYTFLSRLNVTFVCAFNQEISYKFADLFFHFIFLIRTSCSTSGDKLLAPKLC